MLSLTFLLIGTVNIKIYCKTNFNIIEKTDVKLVTFVKSDRSLEWQLLAISIHWLLKNKLPTRIK